MNLIYNDIDIYKFVSVSKCVHEMHAEKRSDSLEIHFNDTNNLWSQWGTQYGDTIRVKLDTADTGMMYVHSIKSVNGQYIIRALSIPPSVQVKEIKSWENISFEQIISQTATANGLDFKTYGVTNQVYKKIIQDYQTDFEFLSHLCMLEGCQMMIYNKTLIVYSESFIESSLTPIEIEIGDNGKFVYERTNPPYFRCLVRCENYVGRFTSSEKSNSTLEVFEKVNSNSEASRFAKGILRDKNKFHIKGKFTKSLQPKIAACSTANIKCIKASALNDKVYIYRVRHDYLKNQSDIYFRGILKGY